MAIIDVMMPRMDGIRMVTELRKAYNIPVIMLSAKSEGSGLGLAIAKSFVELQNGQFQIDVDGDLFKVTLTWSI